MQRVSDSDSETKGIGRPQDGLPEPIHLLSLPRSGSTLLQRLIAAHPDVETASEPNVFLYPALALMQGRVRSLADTDDYLTAIHQFGQLLPGGERDFWLELGLLARRLYALSATSPSKYFLDKSPYYSYIANTLFMSFEQAKFVFLWRHPLSVASSILNYPVPGGDVGRWTLYQTPIIFDGLAGLIDAYTSNKGRAYALRYEDLVKDTDAVMADLLEYLDLPDTFDLRAAFSNVHLQGTLGDPNAKKEEYQAVRGDLTETWKSTFCNQLRKRWARYYLSWIGEERLAIMGYDLHEILAELDAIPLSTRYLRKDAYWMTHGFFFRLLNGRILRDNLKKFRSGEPFWAYK